MSYPTLEPTVLTAGELAKKLGIKLKKVFTWAKIKAKLNHNYPLSQQQEKAVRKAFRSRK